MYSNSENKDLWKYVARMVYAVIFALFELAHKCSECEVDGVSGEPEICKNASSIVECKEGNQMCFAKWKCVGEE